MKITITFKKPRDFMDMYNAINDKALKIANWYNDIHKELFKDVPRGKDSWGRENVTFMEAMILLMK